MAPQAAPLLPLLHSQAPSISPKVKWVRSREPPQAKAKPVLSPSSQRGPQREILSFHLGRNNLFTGQARREAKVPATRAFSSGNRRFLSVS